MAGAPSPDITPILSGFARADAVHDFAGKYSPNSQPNELFNTSVWDAEMSAIPNEDAVLDLIESSPAVGEPKRTHFKNKIMSSAGQITTKTGHTFNFSKVDLNTFGEQLATNLKIKDSALVIDTCLHGFLARLKSGPYTPGTKIYYAYLPESENDPGGKASADTLPSKLKSGIDLVHLIQKNTGPTVYSTSDGYDKANPSKNFNSKFTYTISGLRQSTMPGFKKISVETRVRNRDGRMEQAVFDAKSQNSINAIQKNVFDAILGRGPLSPKDVFSLQAAWGRKRGGDWFQVLACKNLDGRVFNQPLPANTPVFFVTIDRIAMAYALMMGVNVVYFPHTPSGETSSVVVFRQGVPLDRVAVCQSRVAAYSGDPTLPSFLNGIIANRKKALADRIASIDALVPSADTKGYLENLLNLSLEYAHIYLAYAPHAESLLEILTSAPDPCVKMSAYDDLQILYETHGVDVNIIVGFFNTIPNYTASISNLINLFPVQGESRMRAPKVPYDPESADKFSFMSYLSKVQDGNILRTILQAKLTSLYDSVADQQVKNYLSTILGRARLSLYVPDKPVDPAMIESSVEVIRHLEGTKVRRVEPRMEGAPNPKRPRPEGARRRTHRKKRGGWKADTVFPDVMTYDDQEDIISVATVRLLNIGEEIPDRYLPIYMMLEALLREVEPNMFESEDLEQYARLYTLLEKSMTLVQEKEKIGLVLRDLLFTKVQSETGSVNVQEYLGSDLRFTLVCSSLSRALCGEFDEKDIDVSIDGSVNAQLQEFYKGPPTVFASSDEFLARILGLQEDIYKFVTKPVVPVAAMEDEKGMMLSQAKGPGSVTSSEADNSMVETLSQSQMFSPGSRSPPSSDRSSSGAPSPGSSSPPRSTGDGSGSGTEGGRRRKTRRVVLDFLPTRHHQSIKMSSKRHSDSDKELSF